MRALLRLSLTALLPCAAPAHDFWIEPSTFTPAPGASVGLGLRVGEAFQGEALPRIPPYIERFVVRAASGEHEVAGRPGAEPAGLLARAEPGLQVAVYQSRPYPMDIAGPTFDKYLREEGLDAGVALRRQRGETGQPTRERFSRCAKVMVRAGSGGVRHDTAFGCPLEIVPEGDPTASRDGSLGLRLLRDGKPIAGALVVARPRDTPAEALRQTTDAAGHVRFRLPRGGVWLVKSIHLQPAPAGSGVSWESFWASLTFEAPYR